MKFNFSKTYASSLVGALCLTGMSVSATTVEITYENLSQDGGLWNTPLFLGFHDGSYDMFDLGSAVSASVELLAEEGMPDLLVGDIASNPTAESAVIFGDDAPLVGPGVLFNPGSSNSIIIDLNSVENRFLSFASMILPSNDAFIGNFDPLAYDLFDINGNFRNGFVIDILGQDVWDAGTENNDGKGAPFSMIGGTSTPTIDGVATQHVGLGDFIGTQLGNGTTLDHAFDRDTPIGRISVRRVPDTASSIGLMSVLFLFAFQRFTQRGSKKINS